MGGNLSTLSEDELIKTIEDPDSPGELNPKHAEFHRSKCLSPVVAKLRTKIGDEPLDDITKRETLFRYHPDSKLFCVYGKNKYGINGALLSQEEEDKHREIWCEHHDCAPEPTEPASDSPSPSAPANVNTPSSNDIALIAMSGISSSFMLVIFMILLLKNKRY